MILLPRLFVYKGVKFKGMYRIEHSVKEIAVVQDALASIPDLSVKAVWDSSLHIYKAGEEIEDYDLYNIILGILSQRGYSVYFNDGVSVYSSRVQNLLDMAEDGSHFYIENDNDEKHIRELFDMPNDSLDKLARAYNYVTGHELIDHRWDKNHIYTNVAAQSDPDFWREELIT